MDPAYLASIKYALSAGLVDEEEHEGLLGLVEAIGTRDSGEELA